MISAIDLGGTNYCTFRGSPVLGSPSKAKQNQYDTLSLRQTGILASSLHILKAKPEITLFS
jgi:hypothetical protein